MLPTRCTFVAILFLLASTQSAFAQLDRLYSKGQSKPVTGTVMSVSKNAVKFKAGNDTTDYKPGDVEKIMFEGDPGSMTKARESALDGQYEQALEDLKEVDVAKLRREVMKQDHAFYTVLCKGRLALQGRGDKTDAVRAARDFASKNSNSWHFYQVAKLLGDLALSLGQPEDARRFYSGMRSAPSTDTKIESVYLLAMTNLKDGKAAQAKADFEKVIGVKVQSPGALRLQTLATAGKAMALASEGNGKAGLALVDKLIAELNPADVEMAARIYNAQGASAEAAGDKEGAVMAYLHTHLMFSSQPDAHAEALVRLVELFGEIGKPNRAAEVRQELQQRYPGFAK